MAVSSQHPELLLSARDASGPAISLIDKFTAESRLAPYGQAGSDSAELLQQTRLIAECLPNS